MKALITFLPLAAALAACQATNSFDQLSYGSRLDRIRIDAPADPAAATPEGQERARQAAGLREQAQALRNRLALEADRVERIAILRQLQEIGDTLRRLDGGGPLYFEAQPVPDGGGSA